VEPADEGMTLARRKEEDEAVANRPRTSFLPMEAILSDDDDNAVGRGEYVVCVCVVFLVADYDQGALDRGMSDSLDEMISRP